MINDIIEYVIQMMEDHYYDLKVIVILQLSFDFDQLELIKPFLQLNP